MFNLLFPASVLTLFLFACAPQAEKCTYVYTNIQTLKNSPPGKELMRKFCEEGESGRTFLGYSLRMGKQHTDVELAAYEFADTIFWQGDSLVLLFDDFQYADVYPDSSYVIRSNGERMVICELNLSSISKELQLLDKIPFAGSQKIYKYFYKSRLPGKANIQYSLAEDANNLPVKGNLVRASNTFYDEFLPGVFVEKGKIILQYDPRGEEFLFYTDPEYVVKRPLSGK